MPLTEAPTPVPRLTPLKGALAPGEIVVVKEGESQLEDAKWVVLETAHGHHLELMSRAAIPGGADRKDATYLDVSVMEGLGDDDREGATLRRFTAATAVAKLRGGVGTLLALSLALTVLTVVAGIWFAAGTESGPSAKETAAKAARLAAWATEPGTSAVVAATRREQVDACLQGLTGGDKSPPVHGVTCAAPSPSFLKDKDNAGLVGAILAGFAALLTVIGGVRQLGPGKTPV